VRAGPWKQALEHLRPGCVDIENPSRPFDLILVRAVEAATQGLVRVEPAALGSTRFLDAPTSGTDIRLGER
jgi:hypothetical protein